MISRLTNRMCPMRISHVFNAWLPSLILFFSCVCIHGQDESSIDQNQNSKGDPVDTLSDDKAELQGVSKTIVIEKAILKILEQRQIPSRSSGIIQESKIKEGVLVDADDIVMKIDSARVQLEIDKTRLEKKTADKQANSNVDVEFAAKTREVSQLELERANQSNQKFEGLVSDSEIDRLKLMIEKSAAEEKKAEFALEINKIRSQAKDVEIQMFQLDQEHHRIRAPMKGMIVEIMKRPGEWVETSESVARLVRLDILKTEIKISAEVATDKKLIDHECWFYPRTKSLTGKRYPAKVVFVNPEADPVNSTMRVWLVIANENLELRPGLIGRVEVDLPE